MKRNWPHLVCLTPFVKKPDLTERELQVLRWMAEGETDCAIGEQLCISVSTVRKHVRNILEKLECANRTQAAVWALKTGILNGDAEC